jgi:hypothetical protein
MKTQITDVNWQEARAALSEIGFTPLVAIGGAEHWVRDNKRVILHPDCEGSCEDVLPEQTNLHGALYVRFVTIDGTLVPMV